MNYETNLNQDGLLAGEEPDAAAIRKRRRMFILLGVIALIGLIAVIALRVVNGSDNSLNAGEDQAPLVTITVPGTQAVTKIANATGSLAARVDMPVGVVGEGGRVTRVSVQPGDWVTKGQALATIERSVQTQQLAQLNAQVDVARADAKLAQNNLDRARALVSDGFISKADIDQKTATRDAAVAQVKVAQAQLGQMRAQVGHLDIRAPEAGLVLTRNVEPGQVVGASSGVLFRIAKGGELELRAQLSESDLDGVTVGVPAKVTPVGTSHSFVGHVWQVSPVIDSTTRQGVVRIALPYNQLLRPGGFANVAIDMAKVSAPVLPESAVQSDQKGSFVYIVGKQGKVERRDVTTGTVTANGLTITKGLTGNEQVVLYAGGFLNPGETVKTKLAKTAS